MMVGMPLALLVAAVADRGDDFCAASSSVSTGRAGERSRGVNFGTAALGLIVKLPVHVGLPAVVAAARIRLNAIPTTSRLTARD